MKDTCHQLGFFSSSLLSLTCRPSQPLILSTSQPLFLDRKSFVGRSLFVDSKSFIDRSLFDDIKFSLPRHSSRVFSSLTASRHRSFICSPTSSKSQHLVFPQILIAQPADLACRRRSHSSHVVLARKS